MSNEPHSTESEPDGGVPQTLDVAWPPATWTNVHLGVAISGGCDSTALLRAILQLKSKHKGVGKVFALHVNHQLRGDESEQDAHWCQRLCDGLSVPLTILQGTAAVRAKVDGDGLEAAARAERYDLLAIAAEQVGARYLAMAHTQNDQSETVLFRLLRGSGLRGLTGIPSSRPLTSTVTLIRPLLECCRADLIDYLTSLGQTYRADSSNTERRFARNRVRHDLLPKLRKEFNSDVDAALLRLASRASEIQQYLEVQAQELLDRCEVQQTGCDSAHGEFSLALAPLSQEPSVLVCEALRLVWRKTALPEQAMTSSKWHHLAQLAESTDDCPAFNLPDGVQALVSDGRLIVRR